MDFEGKALYNLLRMNWLAHPSLEVESWQVQDYRELDIEELFTRLNELGYKLNSESFSAYSETCQSPEELTDFLVADEELSAQEQDKIYLIVFELWRRLLPENPSISIFCDELDTQIFRYDQNPTMQLEPIQDALANLKVILDENIDQGEEPVETFKAISALCANDLDSFLYDFIADQIDSENEGYATELIGEFYEYIEEKRWFDLLKARIYGINDDQAAHQMLLDILEELPQDIGLEYLLELLAFCAQGSDPEIFVNLTKRVLPLIEEEEDYRETLQLSIDFCDFFEFSEEQSKIENLLRRRLDRGEGVEFSQEDPEKQELLNLLEDISNAKN